MTAPSRPPDHLRLPALGGAAPPLPADPDEEAPVSHIPSAALFPYGWSASRAQALTDGTQPARVLRYDGATLLAITEDGPRSVRVTPGLDPQPTVGDWLALREAPDGVARRRPDRSRARRARRCCAGWLRTEAVRRRWRPTSTSC